MCDGFDNANGATAWKPNKVRIDIELLLHASNEVFDIGYESDIIAHASRNASNQLDKELHRFLYASAFIKKATWRNFHFCQWKNVYDNCTRNNICGPFLKLFFGVYQPWNGPGKAQEKWSTSWKFWSKNFLCGKRSTCSRGWNIRTLKVVLFLRSYLGRQSIQYRRLIYTEYIIHWDQKTFICARRRFLEWESTGTQGFLCWYSSSICEQDKNGSNSKCRSLLLCTSDVFRTFKRVVVAFYRLI